MVLNYFLLLISFSGVIGSGVCVFSRFPIIDAFFYRYSLNGYMYNITHGDWFGGKAVGYCLIDHPKQPIHFFSTHVSYVISALFVHLYIQILLISYLHEKSKLF